MTLVLASGSPRRRALLREAGVTLEVQPADVDETSLAGESPVQLVRRLARTKAAAVAATRGVQPVLAADTVVALDGVVLGKPTDDDEARRMLTAQSGRVVTVWSGLAVQVADRVRTRVVGTFVAFRDLTPDEVDAYVATGEPRDVAGAFRIQGRGARLVAWHEGCWTNVVGLPLCQVSDLLRPLGIASRSDDCVRQMPTAS